MNRIWIGPTFVEVTAADDGLSHRVSQAIYDQAVQAGGGRYRAACGRTVLTAALTTPPGPVCGLCRVAVRSCV